MEQCTELLGRNFQVDSKSGDKIQHTDVVPGGKIEAKDIVDNQIDAETDAERDLSPNVLVEPGDEGKIVNKVQEHDLSTATEIGSPNVEQIRSEDQISLQVAESSEQDNLSTTNEMRPPSVKQTHSDISLPVAERNKQDHLSTTTEVRSPSVEQIHSEDQISLQVAGRNEQEDLDTTTENSALIMEQKNHVKVAQK
ncbi:uncharacterized protein LOC144685654 [Cetorhinus maximus]